MIYLKLLFFYKIVFILIFANFKLFIFSKNKYLNKFNKFNKLIYDKFFK